MTQRTEIPKDFEARKRWIFDQCGHNGTSRVLQPKKLDELKASFADWQDIDTRLFASFGLASSHGADKDVETIQTLAMLDTVLHGTMRFFKMSHIREHTADSTAAHSKQTMNLVQDIFDTAYPDGNIPDSVKPLRREALLGASLHDLGELIVEGTTMDYMNKLSPDERKKTEKIKDEVEDAVTHFAIKYAAKCCIVDKDPNKFFETIFQIKQDVGLIDAEGKTVNEADPITLFPKIKEWIKTHEQELIGGFEVPPHIQELLDIYHRVESKDSEGMLRPIVKCVERLEGVRYLQRNSSIGGNASLELATSFQALTTCERAEKGLPELFELAHKHDQLPLALAIADRAYSTIVRGFMGDRTNGVKRFPRLITIHASANELDMPDELYGAIGSDHTAAVELIAEAREETQRSLHSIQKGAAASYDPPSTSVTQATRAPVQLAGVINRDQAAKYYEAARLALHDKHNPYEPTEIPHKKRDGKLQTLLTLIGDNDVPKEVMPHIKEATKTLRARAESQLESTTSTGARRA